MSDPLDKWYYFVEPVDCGPLVGDYATRHVFMQGFDIVKMVRWQDERFDDSFTDEDVLAHFILVHWASEALDPALSLPGWVGR